MLEPVVLQPALAGLIADRAVDRVVQQQELLHRGARLVHVLARLALDHHAVGGRLLAGGLSFGFFCGTYSCLSASQARTSSSIAGRPGGGMISTRHMRQLAATDRPGCQQ